MSSVSCQHLFSIFFNFIQPILCCLSKKIRLIQKRIYHIIIFSSRQALFYIFLHIFLHALYFIRLITVQYFRSYESKSSQSDICNPLPLRSSTPDNCFVVYQEGLAPPSWYNQVPTHCLLLFAIETVNLLDSVKNRLYQ